MWEYYEQLSQEEQERLQEMIQKLLRQTFLLERSYDHKAGRMLVNKDYYVCEKHMEFLAGYFKVAGIRICENTELGTIYIQGECVLGERLPRLATIYLLLLKLLYDEHMASASSSTHIVTTFGELNGKAGEFRLIKSLASLTEIKRALGVLKRYQMIAMMDTLEELDEQTKILIYPSINVVLLREDIVRLLDSFTEEYQDTEGDSE